MKIKKIFSLIAMLLIMLLALTGCVNVDYNIKVNKDGSGEITYIYGVQKSALDAMQISPDSIMDEMKKEVTESKYEVESYETDEEVGFKATKHIENVTENLSLQEAFGEKYITDTDENRLKIEKTGNKIKYSQNATIDLRNLEDMSYMGIGMKYSITLPTKIDKDQTNGTVSEDGKTITWNLKIGEINQISFEATQTGNLLWIILIAVIVVLVVAGIVLVIMFKHLNKKHKADSVLNETEEE